MNLKITVRKISPAHALVTATLLAVILAPLLLYGPAPDPGLFYIGARKLSHGGTYYQDILDIKPPFIYWFYSAGLTLFGEEFSSIRLLDFILQFLFVLALGVFVMRLSGNRRLAFLVVILYALVYVGLGPENTTQIESYTGVFLLPAMALHLHARRSGRSVWYGAAGLCYGLLLIGKPSYVFVLLGAALFEFLRTEGKWRVQLRRVGVMVAAGILPLGIWIVCLTLGPHNTTASEINTFITERHLHQIVHRGGVRESIHRFMSNWNSEFGPGLLALIVVGVVSVLRRTGRMGSNVEEPVEEASGWNAFVELSIVLLVALLLSCLIEFWFFPYHISRTLLPLAVLSAISVEKILQFIRYRRRAPGFARFVLYASLVPLIVYSPLIKAAVTAGPPLRTFLSTSSVQEAQRASISYFPFVPALDSLHLDRRLASESGKEPSLFVISPNLGMIHALTGTVPRQRLIHGHQLTSRFTLPSWRTCFENIVRSDPPDYLLIEFGDPSIGIQDVQSVEEGLRINGLWDVIHERFERIDSNAMFSLFRLRE